MPRSIECDEDPNAKSIHDDDTAIQEAVPFDDEVANLEDLSIGFGQSFLVGRDHPKPEVGGTSTHDTFSSNEATNDRYCASH